MLSVRKQSLQNIDDQTSARNKVSVRSVRKHLFNILRISPHPQETKMMCSSGREDTNDNEGYCQERIP